MDMDKAPNAPFILCTFNSYKTSHDIFTKLFSKSKFRACWITLKLFPLRIDTFFFVFGFKNFVFKGSFQYKYKYVVLFLVAFNIKHIITVHLSTREKIISLWKVSSNTASSCNVM